MCKMDLCKYLQPKTCYKQTFDCRFTRSIKSITLKVNKKVV